MKLEVMSEDMHGEKGLNFYDCEKTMDDQGTKYVYISEDGVENAICFLKTKVFLDRKGVITTNQIYDLEKITSSMYKTPYLQTQLDLKTLAIKKTENSFELEYEIYTKNILINTIKLKFIEK